MWIMFIVNESQFVFVQVVPIFKLNAWRFGSLFCATSTLWFFVIFLGLLLLCPTMPHNESLEGCLSIPATQGGLAFLPIFPCCPALPCRPFGV